MFRKRYFFALVITIIWLALGIGNFVVKLYRTTPLSAIDFTIAKSGIKIMPMYFAYWQIILLAIAVLAVIAFIIFAWIKLPKKKPNYKIAIPAVAAVALFTTLVTILYIQFNVLSNNFRNLVYAHRRYGFVYCFSRTLFDRGIDRPKDYSKDAIDEIISDIIDADKDKFGGLNGHNNDKFENSQISDLDLEKLEELQKDKPNIIFLQLESFFDVNYMKAFSYSEDPIPIFRHLKNSYSSGFMSVKSIGAGTANTEFEVMTGMSLEFFGVGEYPYTTVLKESTCETISYNLKELMYKTHAIHNHTATFYDRNTVFPKLGFDSFTPLEYMGNVEYTSTGWAKDNILTQEIVKALKSSKGKDFVYTISVQGHGKYPTEISDIEQKIKLSVKDITSLDNNLPEDSEITNEDIIAFAEQNQIPFEYYINQLHEMDKFVGGLISTLKSINEPVVLVIFGDHLPAFEIEPEYLENNDIFQTEYIIWDNIGLEKIDKDLSAYQLSSEILNRLNITNGILTKFHEKNSKNEDYKAQLEMLEHDMLYGEREVYGGVNPYTPTDMKMGIDEITISSASIIEDSIFVIGNNFTKWSNVYLNGKKQATKFNDKSLLIVENTEAKVGDIITVVQIADDGVVLGSSKEYELKQ